MNLAPIRPRGSIEADRHQTRDGRTIEQAAPFERWDRFLDRWEFKQGEHVAIVGPTGSGKTVLAVQILQRREFVVVLGTKNRDPELYDPLVKQGYRIEDRFDPEPEEGDTHLIFRPRLTDPSRQGVQRQAEAFRTALIEVFLAGDWCVYSDEVRYMTDDLGLGTTYNTLYLQGRSLGITMISATQNPVSIPLVILDQATHVFFYRSPFRERVDRMAEYTGGNYQAAREAISRLGRHEFLYANTVTGEMVRSKVIRERETA